MKKKKYRKWPGRSERESKWNQKKTSVVEIKTHTPASLHIHEQVHTQNELNNQVEERSSKPREDMKILSQRGPETQEVVSSFKYERVKDLEDWVRKSHTHLFWVPEQRWDRWERGRIWRNLG